MAVGILLGLHSEVNCIVTCIIHFVSQNDFHLNLLIWFNVIRNHKVLYTSIQLKFNLLRWHVSPRYLLYGRKLGGNKLSPGDVPEHDGGPEWGRMSDLYPGILLQWLWQRVPHRRVWPWLLLSGRHERLQSVWVHLSSRYNVNQCLKNGHLDRTFIKLVL